MSMVSLPDGGSVTLGAPLAKAGEGTIHEVVGRPAWVVKIFHPHLRDLAGKLEKVAAMAASLPDGAVQSDGFVVLAWPLAVVSDDTGRPSGFVMPRIDTSTAVEIHSVSNPSNRLNPLPSAAQWTKNATWGHLVHVAANLCLAAQVAHRADAVIGDFQERNILVSDTARVSLVDCDSVQFTNQSGRRFLCGVGRQEFLAPELAGVDFSSTARDQTSDLFALAVHIHLLLVSGNHPFLRGTWTGPGEQPDALTLARFGHWAGGPRSPLHRHPLAPSVGFLPVEIQRLFVRAFTDGHRNPSLRPTAAEWREALLRIRLTRCPHQAAHQFPISSPRCPWCEVDGERAARKDSRLETVAIPVERPPELLPHGATRTPLSSAVLATIAVATIGALAAVAIVIWAARTANTTSASGTSTTSTANTDTHAAVSVSPTPSIPYTPSPETITVWFPRDRGGFLKPLPASGGFP
ncbi:hypothetical protein JNN96_38245 [Mycobacterium sp. DSM 3803]|nr:hypothetical protein [Mycobacterium sp. DSM 3803]